MACFSSSCWDLYDSFRDVLGLAGNYSLTELLVVLLWYMYIGVSWPSLLIESTDSMKILIIPARINTKSPLAYEFRLLICAKFCAWYFCLMNFGTLSMGTTKYICNSPLTFQLVCNTFEFYRMVFESMKYHNIRWKDGINRFKNVRLRNVIFIIGEFHTVEVPEFHGFTIP